MEIYKALDIKKYPCVISFIGGGGKTTTMFSLANELSKQGKKVLVTTTTHISIAQGRQASRLIVESKYDKAYQRLKKYFQVDYFICLTTLLIEEKEKLKGIPVHWIEKIKEENLVDVIMVEADGAKGKSFKAPAEYEPVLPKYNDIIVAVMGIDVVGRPIIEEYAHRPEKMLELLGKSKNQESTGLTKENIPKIFFHREGILKNIGKDQQIYILINKVDPSQETEALKLADTIMSKNSFQYLKVLIGEVQNKVHPIKCIVGDK